MGRAIVRDPQVFLFDEPLSNLDAKLRVQMRTEIRELHQRLKTTTVYVTHDQIEAMTMADQIVVMQGGRIEQVGAPLELYDRPANTFVAGFIGSPAMNMLPGVVKGGKAVLDDGAVLPLPPGAAVGPKGPGSPMVCGPSIWAWGRQVLPAPCRWWSRRDRRPMSSCGSAGAMWWACSATG
jgi:ABC-type sugar transport system ATPase subunit